MWLRILAVIASFCLVGMALFADRLEVTSPGWGSFLWIAFQALGALLLLWQARRVKRSSIVCIVALIPYLNLILLPLASILLSFLPRRKSPTVNKT